MRNIDLDALQMFKAVVDYGSVTNAAAQLNRVQSNITTRVKNLEQRLGVTLFIRSGGKLVPSNEGRVLYDYAQKLLALSNEAQAALQRGTPRGVLRIGTLESTAASRLPPVLSGYHEHYPDVQVELVAGSSDDLISRVHRSDIEAAFVSEPFNDAGLDSAEAFVEELVLIAARHPGLKNASDLHGQTILTFAKGCSYRRIFEAWLDACEVTPARIMELASYHALTACAVAGTGVAIMPRAVVQAVQAEHLLSIVPLPAKVARTRTHLVWRKGHHSGVLQSLLDELQRSGS